MSQPGAGTERLDQTTRQAERTPASGLQRKEIEALLRVAEPRRIQALSASLNLAGGTFLVLLGHLEGMVLPPVVAALGAWGVWRLAQRLWRDLAIAVLAPAIGERWGQVGFASGWGAVEIDKWLGDLFSDKGMRVVAWQSHGRYREIGYRLTESTIWRRGQSGQRITHVMQVEIAVPRSFSGYLHLMPQAGFASKVDNLLRQVTGSSEQRQQIDPEFDAVFDTIASQNASIDTLLTPEFRRAMLALAARHPQTYLTARFEHGWFSLRLPIPHLVFAGTSLIRPLPDMADDADALWWDLTVPHRLIDALAGNHDGALR
ncbi:DUF3137 domain-containing protein [Devosia submarina]|uniref:DUF3137 domain-containing protein n=1 Tax=Devosia submarina TaxID=1173082 RepID=UPI000D33AD0A|nr:DUF3137 domain-containing protein [Devosia submarina]